jgi:hypothetical protein
LHRFGLPADPQHREQIRTLLSEEIEKEAEEEGDQFLMRLLCAQLFSIGKVEDAEIVWLAKSCNFDTMLGIDVQMLCGAGLQETKALFGSIDSDEAKEALTYIEECEKSGDFDRFPIEQALTAYRHFYGLP